MKTHRARQPSAEVLETRSLLTTFTVNSLLDTGDADLNDGIAADAAGNVTLRAALEQANHDPSTADVIEFNSDPAAGVNFHDATPDVITLDGSQLEISSDITINGPGADLLTVSGDGRSRVFDVLSGQVTFDSLSIADGHTVRVDNSPAGRRAEGAGVRVASAATVNIVNSVIRDNDATQSRDGGTNGLQGGGIFNNGTLTVTNSTVSGNSARLSGGGISNNGTLTVTNTTVSGNSAGTRGGGIRNNGTLTLTNSTVSGNSAGANGGGIFNEFGTLTVTNSTVSGNSATNGGGGIFNDATLTVTNSTVSGNSAGDDGGGIFNVFGGRLTVTNSTVSGNSADAGGGIDHNGFALTVTNSIVAGNTANSDSQISGALVPDDNNIIQDDASSLIGPLANNGGPTLTHALVPGSPAINAGDNSLALDENGTALTTDQRGTGFDRIVGGTVDIGAFEYREADSLVVTTELDLIDPTDNLTSLREALAFANSDPDFSEITFGDGSSLPGGTDFTDATPDTITLGGTRLNISSDLSINGPGADLLTIDAAGNSRVIRINQGDVTIDSVTITNGAATDGVGSGGGIWNNSTGTLTLSNTAIVNNAANSFGGGIASQGPLRISQSTVAENTSFVGGGISASTDLLMSNSTIVGNIAQFGGGLALDSGDAIIVNSTIVGNTAEQTGAGQGAGGIFTLAELSLNNSIVAGNNAESAPDIQRFGSSGAVTLNNSLLGDTSDLDTFSSSNSLLDVDWKTVLINDGDTPVLADNGGSTQTVALLPNSLAINAGNDSLAEDANGNALTTDQRGTGFDRIVSGTVDIGAFEADEAASLVVTTDQDIVDPRDNLTSLREALAFADSDPDFSEITFGDGTGGTHNFHDATPDVITLGGSQLRISSDITINGPGADLLTVSGDDASRVFHIAGGDHDVTLDSLTISNGNGSSVGQGGGIFNGSTGIVTIANAELSDNTAGDGGGLFHRNGTLHIDHSTIARNFAVVGGGMSLGGDVHLTDSWVTENATLGGRNSNLFGSRGGGGIRIVGGTSLTVTTSTISDNSTLSVSGGGGVFGLVGSSIALINSTVSGNSAPTGGGLNTAGALTVVSSTITDNHATFNYNQSNGGGIRNSGTLTVSNSTVSENSANHDGGGIYNDDGTVTVTNSTVSGNSANDDGGGIFSEGTVTVTNSTVSGNTSRERGGGIWSNGNLTVTNSTVSGNSAGDIGGGIASLFGLTVSNSTVSGNTSDESGGGIRHVGTLALTSSTIYGNYAARDAGGVSYLGTYTLNNNIFVGNRTPYGAIGNGLFGNNIYGVPDGLTIRDILDPNLADNGGPTLTHSLVPGSLAINAGDDSLATDDSTDAGTPLTTDQRGESRFVGRVDIGAFEASAETLAQPILDLTVAEDSADEVIDLSQTFADSSAVTLSVDSDNTSLVSASITGTDLTLSFPGDANGSAEITVTATNGSEQTTEAFTVTVDAVDDAGTFGGDLIATIDEDTSASGMATFTDDADGDSDNNFMLDVDATNGMAEVQPDGSWTYSPDADFNGSDSFTVKVTDDDGNVETKVISITVDAVNDAGTFGGDLIATIDEDTSASGIATFTDDADGDSDNNFMLDVDATNGMAEVQPDGSWTYSPDADFNGSDSFTVKVTDDDGNVETKVISITVDAVNDAGTFGGDLIATIDEDTSASGMATFTDDADGDSDNNFMLDVDATNGMAEVQPDGSWTYSPDADFNGSDSFTVKVTDDDGNVETKVISITVDAVNDVPTVDSSQLPDLEVGEGSAGVTIDLSTMFSDVEDTTLTFAAVSSNDAVVETTLAGDQLTLNFPADGEATITVTATDSEGASISDTFTVTVNDVTTEPDPGVEVVDGKLIITGTDGNDQIYVTRWRGNYYVFTNIDGFEFQKVSVSQVDEIHVDGGDGHDQILMSCWICVPTTLNGGAGNDYIHGGHGADNINGGDGNDWIYAGSGNDRIDGGLGNDRIYASWGHDIVYGGDGNDKIFGGSGNDILLGQKGNDIMSGGSGKDILIGGEGSDWMSGGSGGDILITGDTSFDEDEAKLEAMRDLWTSGGSRSSRMNAIMDLGLEVTHDDDVDFAWGGWGHDWLDLDAIDYGC